MLSKMLTGVDNETADAGRVVFLIGVCVYSVCSLFSVWHSHTFDMQGFGIGFGSICAGVGALLKLKEDTEPGAK